MNFFLFTDDLAFTPGNHFSSQYYKHITIINVFVGCVINILNDAPRSINDPSGNINDLSKGINDVSRSIDDVSRSIIDDSSRVMLQIELSLMIVIYDRNMFIVQATV